MYGFISEALNDCTDAGFFWDNDKLWNPDMQHHVLMANDTDIPLSAYYMATTEVLSLTNF